MQSPDSVPPAQRCQAGPAGLFTTLRTIAITEPSLALECSALLRHRPQREFVEKESFVAAMTSDPRAAARHAPRFLNRPWICDAGFFPAMRVAAALRDKDPVSARRLTLLAASRFPGVALREVRDLSDQAVFDAAVLNAPDEAAGLASGNSPTAQAIIAGLQASRNPTARVVLEIVSAPAPNEFVRERASVFAARIASGAMDREQAFRIAAGPGFFSAVADLRIAAESPAGAQFCPAEPAPESNAAPHCESMLYDRVLERTAQMMLRGMDPALKSLNARDAYLALAYGRTEQDETSFTAIFDSVLAPKLRKSGAASLFDSAKNLRVRQFLADAAAHQRLALLDNAVSRCFKEIDRAPHPLEEALAASATLDAIREPVRLRGLESELIAEYRRTSVAGASEGAYLYGLLASSLARRLGPASGAELRAIANDYDRYFGDARIMNAASLFDTAGVCRQQHFFYDDDDGEQSFASFKRAYSGDPRWHWENRDGYVVVTAGGTRKIEIYANIPDAAKLGASSDNDSRHALSRLLEKSGRSPSVVVHRGHSYFVERTVRYLPANASLVYLGSCRGLENVYAVMSAATRARIISTRGVGAMSVNDPLLKALNEELLKGAPSLDWDRFWTGAGARFGGSSTFRDYIPPHRNTPATLLAAYWERLAAGE